MEAGGLVGRGEFLNISSPVAFCYGPEKIGHAEVIKFSFILS